MQLQALAEADGVEAVADLCNTLLQKSLDEWGDISETPSQRETLARGVDISALAARVATLEQAVSQLQSESSLRSRSASVDVEFGEVDTDYRDEFGENRSRSLALPSSKIRTGVFCSRTICNMLGLSYPAGLESLAHHHGGQFARDGHRFTRLEQKKYGRSKRWRVEAIERSSPFGRDQGQ